MPKKKPPLVNPESPLTLAAHRLSLARDVLDDIELSRLGPEQLLLKASRLARLVDDNDARQWLAFELQGYPNTEFSRRYMTLFNRWTDKDNQLGYWTPLASLAAWTAAMQAEILQLRVPDVSVSLSSSNPHELVTGYGGSSVTAATAPVNATLQRLQARTTAVAQLREIQSRVLSSVHDFAVKTYYRLAFSGAAESIFRDHQNEVDGLLRDSARDVIEKIPAITARLGEGDGEAISQALNSCRRMIKAFGDAVQPPEDKPVEADAETYSIAADKVLNRIQYFLSKRCSRKGRRERLNRNLRSIWDRASAGTHSDITAGEARALFLQTYLTLGEVLGASREASGQGAATEHKPASKVGG